MSVTPALSTKSAPVATDRAGGLLVRGSGLGFGSTTTEHDTASEDGGLATIVVGDLGLGDVNEDLGLASTLTTGELGERLLGVGRGDGGSRAGAITRGEGEARARVGRARAGTGVESRVDGGSRGRRVGTRNGRDTGELSKNGSQPGRFANFMSDHSEKLLLLFILQELLSDRLEWAVDHSCDRASVSLSTKLSLELQLGELLLLRTSLLSHLLGPNGEKLGSVSEANGDAARVDEEIELNTTENGDPLGPLDASGLAGHVDGTRRSGIGRKGEAATARTTKGLSGVPVVGELSREVGFESELQLDDGRSGVASDQGAREVSDRVSKGNGERAGSGSGHCDRDDAVWVEDKRRVFVGR